MAETLSAAIAAGVLADISGGVLHDDEAGDEHPGAAAIPWARSVEQDGARYL